MKKVLYEQNIEDEVESLYNVSRLCHFTNENKQRVRGPFLAIVSMDSSIVKKRTTTAEWIYSKIKDFYVRPEVANDLDFNDVIGLITSLRQFSVFKTRPMKELLARFVAFEHREDEEYLSLQFLLTGLLSVYYDPSRSFISRPGFTSFESRRPHDRSLGTLEVKIA